MQHFDVVVFDVDGTLLDTSEGVLASVKYTIGKHNLPEIDEETLRTFIGPPIQDSFARVYGLSGDILQELATTFRNQYKDVDLLKAVPYEGIFDVFEALLANGIKPAIATYKRQDYATKIMQHFGFDKYTDIIYGADHENKLKKRDIIELALKDSGVSDFSKAVMIGDSDNDAIGAEGIGTEFIGVTYGFGFRRKEDVNKFKNVGIADTAKELRMLLVGDK